MQENHITNASQKVAQNGILEHLVGTFLKEVLWNKSRDVGGHVNDRTVYSGKNRIARGDLSIS